MTIKERILQYVEYKGIKKTDFFTEMGFAPSNFKGAAKNSELGSDKIARILTSYPDLSAEWLLLGTGEMIKVDKDNPSTNDTETIKKLVDLLQKKEQQIDNLNKESDNRLPFVKCS